jgi:hypothetical protein
VTIAIVARSWIQNCIVAVSDRSLAYFDANATVHARDDAALKAFSLSQSWGLLYAADDISHVTGIVSEARQRLRDSKGSITVGLARTALCEAYRAVADERIVGRYLARYGINTVAEFRQTGFNQFGPEVFKRLADKIDEFDLGVSLLVYGFSDDSTQDAHIFEITNPGDFKDHDIGGLGIIGSGFWPALASLTNHQFSVHDKLPTIVYRLCEAKFFAEESDPAVGKATTVMVFGTNGRMVQLSPADIERLREVWKYERNLVIHTDAWDVLDPRLKSLTSEE